MLSLVDHAGEQQCEKQRNAELPELRKGQRVVVPERHKFGRVESC